MYINISKWIIKLKAFWHLSIEFEITKVNNLWSVKFYSVSLFSKLINIAESKEPFKYVMHKESQTLASAHISISRTFVTLWGIPIKTEYSVFNFYSNYPVGRNNISTFTCRLWWDELLWSQIADACFITTAVCRSIKMYPKYPLSPVNNDRSTLYAFFWVTPRRLKFICLRFGTLCLFHLHRQVDLTSKCL